MFDLGSKYITLIFFFSVGITPLFSQSVAWSSHGDNGNGYGNRSKNMAVDKDGNAYVLGTFEDTLKIGTSVMFTDHGQEVFLAKYSSTGALLWLKQFGRGAGLCYAGDIKMDNQGNLVIFCYFYSPGMFYSQTLLGGFLGKLDPDGNFIWSKSDPQFAPLTFEADFRASSRIQIDDTNNIIVFASDNLAEFPAPTNIYLFKFDPSGNKVWKKLFGRYNEFPNGGGSLLPRLGSIALDSHNNIILTGYFMEQITIGPEFLKTHFPRPPVNSGITQTFISKFSADGIFQWVEQGDFSYLSEGFSLTTDSADNIYFTGTAFAGTQLNGLAIGTTDENGFIGMMAPTGRILWIKPFTSGLQQYNSVRPYSISKDPLGGLYIAGSYRNSLSYQTFSDNSSQGYEAFIMKITTGGDLIGIMISNDSTFTSRDLYQIIPVSAENVYVVGTFQSSLHLGGASITVPDNLSESMAVMKIGQFPVVRDDMSIEGSSAFCVSTVLTATEISGATEYVWTLPPGVTPVSGTNTTTQNSIAILVGPSAGSATVTVTTSVGGIIHASQSYTLPVSSLLVGPLVLSGPASVCAPAANLTYSCAGISGEPQFEWSLTGGIAGTASDSVNAARTLHVDKSFLTGSIYVTVKGNCNNLVSNVINVNVPAAPGSPRINGPLTICTNSADTTYSFSLVKFAISYVWQVPPGMVIRAEADTVLSVFFQPSFASGYLKVTPVGTCGAGPYADSVFVRSVPMPTLASPPSGPSRVCESARNVVYIETPLTNAVKYNWAITDGTGASSTINTNSNSVSLNGLKPGVNIISVAGINQCHQWGIPSQVPVEADPHLEKPSLKTAACDAQLSTDKTTPVQWYKNGHLLDDTLAVLPIIDSGYYKVSIKNLCGVMASDSIAMYPVIKSGAPIPNVVTPNGDNKNDYFEIDKSLLGSALVIVDRWGGVIFRTENYSNNWTGANQDAGVYFYCLQSGCMPEPFKGWVQVMK